MGVCKRTAFLSPPSCPSPLQGEGTLRFTIMLNLILKLLSRRTSFTNFMGYARRNQFQSKWYIPYNRIGNLRTGVPVSAYTALATAGAIGGTPGSPTPPGGSVLGTM